MHFLRKIYLTQGYQDLESDEAAVYSTLKTVILAQYRHNLAARAQHFHAWSYDYGSPVINHITQLARLTRNWLMTGEGPTLLNQVILDKCIRALSREAKRLASQSHPETINQLIHFLENHPVTVQILAKASPPCRSGEPLQY